MGHDDCFAKSDAEHSGDIDAIPVRRAGPVRFWLMPYRRGDSTVLARECLAGVLDCSANDIAIDRDCHGRPYLSAPFQDYDINWSHSSDRFLLAFGHGVRLGVDIERIRAYPKALLLARRYFDAGEAEALAASADINSDFFRYWCAKEALLKAQGRGIAFGLNKVIFAPGDDTASLRLIACPAELGSPQSWHWLQQCESQFQLAITWRTR